MKCGIILGASSSYGKMIFTLQKKNVRIMAGAKPRNSYRSLFMRLEILPPLCECMFSLMNFTVDNQEHFQTNSAVQGTETICIDDSYQPVMFSKESAYYCYIKLFNYSEEEQKRTLAGLWADNTKHEYYPPDGDIQLYKELKHQEKFDFMHIYV
jgi:hypothetical protein